MKVTVVITSINSKENTSIPEIEKRCKMKGWDLVVVGDKKTPDMSLSYGTYLSPEKQLSLPYKLTKRLPWNCYERKNIGYLYAYHQGADYVISTDDDNYPIDGWEDMPSFFSHKKGPMLYGRQGLANPWIYFNNTLHNIWPRGLPMTAIDASCVIKNSKYSEIGIISGLVDLCPDFDALGHLYFDEIKWEFKKDKFLFKQLSTFAPYNTQNTVIRRDLIPLQMLSHGIGRASDIWTSYISQHVMRTKGIGVLYISPTVYQKRNTHDLIKDFHDEKETILYTEKLNKTLISMMEPKKSIIDCYYDSCDKVKDLFPCHFMKDIETWLQDIDN